MNLDDSEDQTALGDLVRQICHDHCSSAVVRQMEGDPLGYPPSLWAQFAAAGLTGTLVSESHGGTPVSMLENAAMHEQLGRALAPLPLFVSSVVCALALAHSHNQVLQEALLPGIASGKLILTPAWLEPGGGFAPAGVQLQATPTATGVQLSGSKRHVFFADAAGQLLVLARTGEEAEAIDLFLVPTDAPGLSLEREANMAGESQCLVLLEGVEAEDSQRLTRGGSGWQLWQQVMSEAIILDAARAVGLAARALEITVAYASEREQFDQPIAAFQSISHYLADCSTAVEGARVLVYEAAWAHSHGQPYRVLAAMAKLFACRTARDVTAKAQQIHGGIGFTLDYDIQLFFRRAKQQQLNWWDSPCLEEIIAAGVLDSDQPFALADPFLQARHRA